MGLLWCKPEDAVNNGHGVNGSRQRKRNSVTPQKKYQQKPAWKKTEPSDEIKRNTSQRTYTDFRLALTEDFPVPFAPAKGDKNDDAQSPVDLEEDSITSDLKQYTRTVILTQKIARGFVARSKYKKSRKYIVTIQTMIKRALAMRMAEDLNDYRIIQSLFRRHNAQKTLEQKKYVVVLNLQNCIRRWIAWDLASRRMHGVTTLQSLIRRYRASLVSQRIGAAKHIQRIYRGFVVRRDYRRVWLLRAQKSKFRAIVKGFIARRRYKRLKRRARIVKEILDTEREYVTRLLMIRNLYFNPITAKPKKFGITQENVKEIFPPSLQIITDFHSAVLLTRLLERSESWNAWQTLGDCFSQFSGFLKVYTTYINNYEASLKCLLELKADSPKFAAYLLECSSRPESKLLDIQSLLIEPIQRIPRYQLLLTDLLKKTLQVHDDYPLLQKALLDVKQVASMINNRKAVHEDKQKVLEAFKLIVPPQTYLIQPTRSHVHNGLLKELILKDDRQEGFHYFLFNDLLIKTKHSGVFKTKKFRAKWDLSKLTFTRDLSFVLPKKKVIPLAFALRYGENSMILRAKTEKDFEAWTAAFELAMTSLGDMRKSRQLLLSNSAGSRSSEGLSTGGDSERS